MTSPRAEARGRGYAVDMAAVVYDVVCVGKEWDGEVVEDETKEGTHPSAVGSWMILEMALHGKCPIKEIQCIIHASYSCERDIYLYRYIYLYR